MLCKLAWGNVRRASRDYLVYLLTLTLAVTIFYAFNTIALQTDIAGIENDGVGELLGGVISGLTLFLGAVMGFLMVYANNFIMRRRKKEFGLYQVFGMGRGQVARVMALETAIVSMAALVLGIALGVLLSWVMTFFTASLFKTQIASFHFFFSPTALFITLACLVLIFVVTLVFNLRVVRRSRIADLMGSGRKNEVVRLRSPWVSIAVFAVGAVATGVAYARLLSDGMPISGDPAAMQGFIITTVMVVVGTILLFFGLSGFLLRALQSARGLYWSGLNMFTVRQLSAKVNTVSFSMAVISMVLFLAVTSVVTGMSITDAMNSSIERSTPVDYTQSVGYTRPADVLPAENQILPASDRKGLADGPFDVLSELSRTMVDPERPDGKGSDFASIAGDHVQIDEYLASADMPDAPFDLMPLLNAVVREMPTAVVSSGSLERNATVIGEGQYNRYLDFRGLNRVSLGPDGYLVLCDLGATVTDAYNKALAQGVEIEFAGRTLHPAAAQVDQAASVFTNAQMGMNGGTLVVPDELLEKAGLPLATSHLLMNYAEGVSVEEGDAFIKRSRSHISLRNEAGEFAAFFGASATRTEIYEGMDSLNGLISYLAIYIGFVLVVACGAILTIQQLSGVADAGRSYRTLSELGTPARSVMRSVLVQQAVFFGFPLLVGMVHALVALMAVLEIVRTFGGLTIEGTAGLATGIFLVAYGGYFAVTYVMSKGLVRDAIRVRHAA